MKMKVASAIICLLLPFPGSPQTLDANECLPLGQSCAKDFDCCGHGTVREGVVLCETRTARLGPRCYNNKRTGESCETNSQCFSQICKGGICLARPPPHTIYRPTMIDFTTPYYSVDSIEGVRGECPCGATVVLEDTVQLAIDGTVQEFVTNKPFGSGLILRPHIHIPLRGLQLCVGPGDSNYDPACIKVEAKRTGNEDWKVIYDGPVELPKTRPKGELDMCTDINISGTGRVVADSYKITFNCVRNIIETCGTSECTKYELRVGEVKLLGYAQERNLCRLPTENVVKVDGDFWCKHCNVTVHSPNEGGVISAFDDNILTSYTNFASNGSGMIVRLGGTPINAMRIYSSTVNNVNYEPVGYSISCKKDGSNGFTFLTAGNINMGDRNTGATGLKHFAQVEWETDEVCDEIKVTFSTGDACHDLTCSENVSQSACVSCPLVIAEVQFFSYC